jgi:hypothetical protein
MSNLGIERPKGWEGSSLGQFFETLFSNSLASYDNLRNERARLEAINKVFDDLIEDFVDPEHHLPALLIIRAIGAYRLAALLSMTVPIDAHTVMRSCLEYAGYAHLIKVRPELGKLWLLREDSDHSRDKVRNTFSAATIKKTLKAANAEIGKRYQDLYEYTISNGAHPNELALTNSLLVTEHPGQTRFTVIILPNEGQALRESMGTCAWIGPTVLEICSLILPTRFKERRLDEVLKVAAKGL